MKAPVTHVNEGSGIQNVRCERVQLGTATGPRTFLSAASFIKHLCGRHVECARCCGQECPRSDSVVVSRCTRCELRQTQDQPASSRRMRAFTLVELLVVIAIIGILIAILLPVLNDGKRKAARTQCSNNLKQLAYAVNLYADDHDDQLPGPVWQGLYPVYDNTTTLFMPYYIANYLGLPAPSYTMRGVQAAVCPASAKITGYPLNGQLSTTERQPISYIETIAVTNAQDNLVSHPFGYPYELLPNGTTNEPPKRLKEIRNPSSSWALEDTDQQNAASVAAYYQFIPATPAHITVRNELFFDWHVEVVKP